MGFKKGGEGICEHRNICFLTQRGAEEGAKGRRGFGGSRDEWREE
jgi:hypothetical protein